MIFFDKPTSQFHQRILASCKTDCDKLQAYFTLIESNQVVASQRTTGNLIEELQQYLHLFIFHNPSFLASASTFIPTTSRNKFFEGLYTYIAKSMTICAYLTQIITVSNPAIQNVDKLHISQYRAYFLLLGAILSFNAAHTIYSSHKDCETAIELVVTSLKWLEDFELNHLNDLNDNIIFLLRKELIAKLVELQVEISKSLGAQIISPDDLRHEIERKNQHAQLCSLSYYGKVIFGENITHSYLPDPIALQKLYTILETIHQNKKIEREQLIFYYNTAYGHVELVDVVYDCQQQKLCLINVSSSNLTSQLHFLKALKEYLNKKSIPFDLIACQANIQRDGASCGLYAYALSGIVAKLSFQSLKSHGIAQPRFFDVNHQNGTQLDPLEAVCWVSPRALGNKAQLISQSFSYAKQELSNIHSEEKAKTLFEHFKIKYQLIEAENLEKKHTYINYLRARFAKKIVPDFQKLKEKLNTKTEGQMMRRAVDFATSVEFDFLLKKFAALDLQNNPLDEADNNPNKALTPLLYALQRSTPSRAIKLLLTSKVSAEKRDARGKNAQDYFAELPSDSAVAQNPVLKKFLGR